jgi:hypothetical protein
MSLHDDPPWDLGQTLGVSSTADGKNWVGAVKVFTDVNPRTGTVRSARLKRCIAVRNTSGVALLPKKLVKFADGSVSAVDAYTRLDNAVVAGVVDEYLPSTGVSANDVFWVTVDGPTEVSLGIASAAAINTDLVALTATSLAATDATTGGRAQTASVTTAAQVLGYVGRAMSAGAAGADILVHTSLVRS